MDLGNDNTEELNCLLCQQHISGGILHAVDEFNIVVYHKSCYKLMNKRNKLKTDLKNVEMKIFKKFIGN